MKLNHMICPNCGHDFFIDSAYATCDACQTFFYASDSKTSQKCNWEFKRYEDGRPNLLAPKIRNCEGCEVGKNGSNTVNLCAFCQR